MKTFLVTLTTGEEANAFFAVSEQEVQRLSPCERLLDYTRRCEKAALWGAFRWEEQEEKREYKFGRALIEPIVFALCRQQTATSLAAEKGFRAQPPGAATVMADLQRFWFKSQIYSIADVLATLDTIVTFLSTKSLHTPTPNLAQSSKTVDGRIRHSPKKVCISTTLNTSAKKCRWRNLSIEIVRDEDTTVCSRTACPGEILLGNPFLLHAGLNKTDVVA